MFNRGILDFIKNNMTFNYHKNELGEDGGLLQNVFSKKRVVKIICFLFEEFMGGGKVNTFLDKI